MNKINRTKEIQLTSRQEVILMGALIGSANLKLRENKKGRSASIYWMKPRLANPLFDFYVAELGESVIFKYLRGSYQMANQKSEVVTVYAEALLKFYERFTFIFHGSRRKGKRVPKEVWRWLDGRDSLLLSVWALESIYNWQIHCYYARIPGDHSLLPEEERNGSGFLLFTDSYLDSDFKYLRRLLSTNYGLETEWVKVEASHGQGFRSMLRVHKRSLAKLYQYMLQNLPKELEQQIQLGVHHQKNFYKCRHWYLWEFAILFTSPSGLTPVGKTILYLQ